MKWTLMQNLQKCRWGIRWWSWLESWLVENESSSSKARRPLMSDIDKGKSRCRLWPTSINTNAMASMVMPYFVATDKRVDFLRSALLNWNFISFWICYGHENGLCEVLSGRIACESKVHKAFRKSYETSCSIMTCNIVVIYGRNRTGYDSDKRFRGNYELVLLTFFIILSTYFHRAGLL